MAELCIVLRDETGATSPSTTVSVWADETATTLATLYSDRARTVVMTNPTTSDADGLVRAYSNDATLWYTTPAQSTALPLPVIAALDGVVDVGDFGVVADGVTDDTAAIQAAIDVLPVSGGVLRIPAGTYSLASALTFSALTNLQVEAYGAEFVASARSSLTATPFNYTFVRVLNCSYLVLRGLKIDANGYAHACLGMVSCDHCTVEECEFTGSATGCWGLVVAGEGDHNAFLHNHAHDSEADVRGLWLGNPVAGYAQEALLVDGNHVHDTGFTGIVLSGPLARCVNNHVHDVGMSGIIWSGDSAASTAAIGVIIANNICTDVVGHGIQQDGYGCEGITVIGNVCARAAYSGIWIAGYPSGTTPTYFVTISGNVCYDNVRGISVHGGGRFGITGNLCYDSRSGVSRTQEDGIRIVPQGGIDIEDTSITGNVCYNNTTRGIYLESTIGPPATTLTGVAISGNTCSGSQYGIILSEQAGAFTNTGISVTGNVCRNNTTDLRTSIVDIHVANNIFATSTGLPTAAPVSGTWKVGDVIWNFGPAATEYIGWVCVTAGTPGTWKGFGTIEA